MPDTTKEIKTRGRAPHSLRGMALVSSLQTMMADPKAVLRASRELGKPDGEGGSTRVETFSEVPNNQSHFIYTVLWPNLKAPM